MLITPFVLRATYSKSAPAAATGVPLVIVTPHDEGIRREFAEAFSRWHQQHYGQPVAIDYRNYGGSAQIVKFFNDSRTLYDQIGTYRIDLAWGGGDFLFNQQLKKDGHHLEGVVLPPELLQAAYPRPTLAGLALYDTDQPPQWLGVKLSGFGIAYNKDVMKYLGASEPKTWSDLADPRFAGWIVMADPTQSASAKTAYMIIVERAMADAQARGESMDAGWARGMGQLRQIAANARLFVDSGSAQPGVVATGDAGAAMVIDFFARATIASVGSARMGYVEPINATAINPDPVALVRGAEHRETAIHFIEFLLSPQAQRLWINKPGSPDGPRITALHCMPVRRDVYEDRTYFTDNADPYHNAESFNTSNARKQTFVILGELMQASMIDLLDELRETRRVILASPHAAELDARLGLFPFDQAEALRRAAAYNDRQLSAAGRLALQRSWTYEFRSEYQHLRELAAQP